MSKILNLINDFDFLNNNGNCLHDCELSKIIFDKESLTLTFQFIKDNYNSGLIMNDENRSLQFSAKEIKVIVSMSSLDISEHKLIIIYRTIWRFNKAKEKKIYYTLNEFINWVNKENVKIKFNEEFYGHGKYLIKGFLNDDDSFECIIPSLSIKYEIIN